MACIFMNYIHRLVVLLLIHLILVMAQIVQTYLELICYTQIT